METRRLALRSRKRFWTPGSRAKCKKRVFRVPSSHLPVAACCFYSALTRYGRALIGGFFSAVICIFSNSDEMGVGLVGCSAAIRDA